jgi:membrane-bound lytic murein transglycosylase D
MHTTFFALGFVNRVGLYDSHVQRRFLLLRKVSFTGIIFFLSFSCLSNAGAQSDLHSYSTKENVPSTRQEAEMFPFQESPASYWEKTSTFIPPGRERLTVETLAGPGREESNDNIYMEFLVRDQRTSEFDFDIPIVINARVEQFIECFQTTARERFVTWLGRSQKYIPLMKDLFKAHGLPEDLVYIAFIESGFDPYAYSRSRASGPWQFIYWTGKKYGLKVNWWVDERRDPEKSTLAAAKYLKDLHERFACWYLAAAGYNAGEYKIINAMKRYRTVDFWKLAEYRYLKRETKNYVPQMIAAALIAKDPKRYGFTDVEYEEPLRYERVKVPELTGLLLVAKACETSVEEIKDLNPELQRGVTPPNEDAYEMKIPFGKKGLFLKNFEALQPLEKFEFKTHLVKTGETLSGIAGLYRVDLEPFLELNHLKRTSRISKGIALLIPLSKDEEIKRVAMAKKKNGKVQKDTPKKRNLSL